MPMSKDDRIAFSLKIVGADAEVKGLESAKASLLVQQDKVQKLDTANANLFNPTNVLVNAYQAEIAKLDGNVRTTIVEQDIIDSANKKVQNHFFPNDLSTTVPSLTSLRNVWPRVQPFALSYGVGLNYIQVYPSTTTKEPDLITAALSYITAAGANLDIENTSGQHLSAGAGSCSNPLYTSQATCIANGGIWTPGISDIVTFDAVVTLKTNLVSAVNTLKTFLNAELALIPTDPANVTVNNAAKNNITNVIIAALDTWLAYPDFQPVPGSVDADHFNSYDSNLLAPTKLHSSQLTALQSALNARQTFVSTRITQIQGILGSISQDITTGEVTSQSGLYGKRFGFLGLRLNALGGSLTQLAGLQTASGAQDSIKANIVSTKATYQSIIPTTMLKANASGSQIIHVVDPSFLSVGDQVYIYAENQEELIRAVKAIQGDMVTLGDVVPAKYRTSDKARLYKDIT